MEDLPLALVRIEGVPGKPDFGFGRAAALFIRIG
jgi:hypothetical protein